MDKVKKREEISLILANFFTEMVAPAETAETINDRAVGVIEEWACDKCLKAIDDWSNAIAGSTLIKDIPDYKGYIRTAFNITGKGVGKNG